MAHSRRMARARAYLLLGALLRVGAAFLDLSPAEPADTPGNPTMSIGGEEYRCPKCEELFTRLETLPDGTRRQETLLQLRGEPKSGTTFMFSWAYGILVRTCERLQDTYGYETCHTEHDKAVLTMIFEPKIGNSKAPCSCDTIHRVQITINAYSKHVFPIDRSCRWWHSNGIPDEGQGCWSVGGRAVENGNDVWGCMHEASCVFRDPNQQFVAMRDPRAVAVSTHFYVRANPKYYGDHLAQNHTLDETVMKILPQVCLYTTLRHILFSGIVPDRSEIFFYDDALQNPLEWHHRWMALAGLLLPKPWTEAIAASVGTGKWATKVNPHPGGEKATLSRTWRDEVSPHILGDMDDILRTWLPGVLLARFDVPP
ncbi:unnamed protein product [Scytosiphon promiscuus]